jgi:acyl-[acyl-carrier-protein]-phospholipid O-acyltransferase / long-chain-fatty-acid--[acyl-carrier-protein] ligase
VSTQPSLTPASAPDADQIVGAAGGPSFDRSGLPRTLAEALLRARREHGGAKTILEDHDRNTLSYDGLITAAHALAARLGSFSARGEAIGVLLPTSIGAVIALSALYFGGRTPAMLNYSAGARALCAACSLAGVRVILTSRRFLKEARLEAVAGALARSHVIVELETVLETMTPLDKLAAFVRARLPPLGAGARPEDPAAVLFTSGTTGAPKGVVLSHANLIANIEQCRLQTKFDPAWVFFNTLPIFHAFGLTGGTLLPIISGLKTVLYPSPLHHERIPALIEATGANVLLSTDTFASHYVRAARPGALDRLVYVILGAERVREETRDAYKRACGAEVMEGYGATECSPVVSVNAPQANKPGTVGRLLPGVEARIVRVAGLNEGGQLFIRGPNVMKGYLHPGAAGQVDPPPEGWFDTGDLAALDDDGYLTILGRLKRFARIGAEMVSLVAVEAHAQQVWPQARHAALAVAGEDRPEQVVLLTEQSDATLGPLIDWAKAHAVRPLELPQRVIVVAELPTLSTGKIDYPGTQRLAETRLAERAQSNG